MTRRHALQRDTYPALVGLSRFTGSITVAAALPLRGIEGPFRHLAPRAFRTPSPRTLAARPPSRRQQSVILRRLLV